MPTLERHLFTSTQQAKGYSLAAVGPGLRAKPQLAEKVESVAFKLSGYTPLRPDNLVALPVGELLLLARVGRLQRDWAGRAGGYVTFLSLPLAEVAQLPGASIASLLLNPALGESFPALSELRNHSSPEPAQLPTVALTPSDALEERLRTSDLVEPLDTAIHQGTAGTVVRSRPDDPATFLALVLALTPRKLRPLASFAVSVTAPEGGTKLPIGIWLSGDDTPAPPPADRNLKQKVVSARASFAKAESALGFFTAPDRLSHPPITALEHATALFETEKLRAATQVLPQAIELTDLSPELAAERLCDARQAAVQGLSGMNLASWEEWAKALDTVPPAQTPWLASVTAQLIQRQAVDCVGFLLPLLAPRLVPMQGVSDSPRHEVLDAILEHPGGVDVTFVLQQPGIMNLLSQKLPLPESASQAFAVAVKDNTPNRCAAAGDVGWTALLTDWLTRSWTDQARTLLASCASREEKPWNEKTLAELTADAMARDPKASPLVVRSAVEAIEPLESLDSSVWIRALADLLVTREAIDTLLQRAVMAHLPAHLQHELKEWQDDFGIETKVGWRPNGVQLGLAAGVLVLILVLGVIIGAVLTPSPQPPDDPLPPEQAENQAQTPLSPVEAEWLAYLEQRQNASN